MITIKSKNTLKTLFVLALVMVAAGAAFPATFTVMNTSDSGSGSLRQAINLANGTFGPDLIDFDIDIEGTGLHTIFLLSALPDIVDSVVIDGYTQDGASPATAATSANLQIVLDGSNNPENATVTILVIRFDTTHDCVIRGLKIQNFGGGIEVGGNHNSVEGNHIFNCTSGIYFTGEYNTIGGLTPAQRNVVNTGNVGIGIFPDCTHNLIQGNYVGTDVDGEFDTDGLLVGEGIGIGGSYNTVVGNLISGYEKGIAILKWEGEGNPIPENNVVEGNKIGTDVYGIPGIPNGFGIWLSYAMNTTIRGNLIAGNEGHGVQIDNGDQSVFMTTGNTITRNSIYDNDQMGINLGIDGVTPNDPGDIDIGPNNLMNFPELTSAMATPGQLVVTGTIDTPNLMSVRLEFFANSTPDSSGNGEGEIYLGAAKPNATGAFTAALPPVLPGTWISATATDRDGNTSEFALTIEATKPGKP